MGHSLILQNKVTNEKTDHRVMGPPFVGAVKHAAKTSCFFVQILLEDTRTRGVELS